MRDFKIRLIDGNIIVSVHTDKKNIDLFSVRAENIQDENFVDTLNENLLELGLQEISVPEYLGIIEKKDTRRILRKNWPDHRIVVKLT